MRQNTINECVSAYCDHAGSELLKQTRPLPLLLGAIAGRLAAFAHGIDVGTITPDDVLAAIDQDFGSDGAGIDGDAS